MQKNCQEFLIKILHKKREFLTGCFVHFDENKCSHRPGGVVGGSGKNSHFWGYQSKKIRRQFSNQKNDNYVDEFQIKKTR